MERNRYYRGTFAMTAAGLILISAAGCRNTKKCKKAAVSPKQVGIDYVRAMNGPGWMYDRLYPPSYLLHKAFKCPDVVAELTRDMIGKGVAPTDTAISRIGHQRGARYRMPLKKTNLRLHRAKVTGSRSLPKGAKIERCNTTQKVGVKKVRVWFGGTRKTMVIDLTVHNYGTGRWYLFEVLPVEEY